MLVFEKKYCLSDVMIVPSKMSYIEHRSECSPYTPNGTLPLFTSPMDSVVDLSNMQKYIDNGIIPILPRTEKIEDRLSVMKEGKWVAFSLNEFIHYFCEGLVVLQGKAAKINVLIDVANGHMNKIYDSVKTAKVIYGDAICVMVGNIANPETFKDAVAAGVDYVRCSIGTGSCCITATQTGIHYPMASLLAETVAIKNEMSKNGFVKTKIIADGGMRNFSDIIKALALGADYVMCGSLFASMIESSCMKYRSITAKNVPIKFPIERYEKVFRKNGEWYGDYTDEFVNEMAISKHNVQKNEHYIGNIKGVIYGMASKDGQIAINGEKTHTSEGITKTIDIEYTMEGWTENFKDYLRSAMSYTGSKNLDEFKNAKVVLISENTKESINK